MPRIDERGSETHAKQNETQKIKWVLAAFICLEEKGWGGLFMQSFTSFFFTDNVHVGETDKSFLGFRAWCGWRGVTLALVD
ncbi:hypothetical protein RchiOBHm_Chr6g0261991 [Rosa chinensis]|uniref:Uncharacterized protein n=1 Tax=Rosa chinensis TaxID=74649 RepID=A0A2P6PNJ0_ROSCH|nr:hypothetical protein RchiOBHm_Chr6g0261991 [Rosa chinensis]